jgi:two-component system response regulator FixJ
MSATVYVVDDEDVILRSLAELLEGEGFAVRTFASAEEFLVSCERNASGCILLDVRLPGLDGLQAQETLQARGIEMPVIFLTGHGDVPMSVRAMKAGAFDFLQKPARADALIGRVHAALRHDEQRRAGRAGDQEARAQLERLTKRERDVLALLLRGRTNKQVAREMGISPRTAEVHRRNILQKTRSGNLLELDALHRRAQKPAKA